MTNFGHFKKNANKWGVQIAELKIEDLKSASIYSSYSITRGQARLTCIVKS